MWVLPACALDREGDFPSSPFFFIITARGGGGRSKESNRRKGKTNFEYESVEITYLDNKAKKFTTTAKYWFVHWTGK